MGMAAMVFEAQLHSKRDQSALIKRAFGVSFRVENTPAVNLSISNPRKCHCLGTSLSNGVQFRMIHLPSR